MALAWKLTKIYYENIWHIWNFDINYHVLRDFDVCEILVQKPRT